MEPQLEEPDLRSYLGVLKRRKWLAAATGLLVFGAVLAVTLLTEPKYELRARVQTRDAADLSAIILAEGRVPVDLNRLAEEQLSFVGGTDMRFAVGRVYDGRLPLEDIWRIEATDVNRRDDRTSNVVELSLISSDPEEARDLVNVYAETYAEKVRADQMEALLTTMAEVQTAITEYNDSIAEIREPITELEEARGEALGQGNQAQVESMQAQIDSLNEEIEPQLQPLRRRLSDLHRWDADLAMGTSFVSSSGARVLSSARVPSGPVSPNVPLNLLFGLTLALFLGVAAAFVRDHLDDSVTSKDLVERTTGVPALGLIPRFDTGDSELVAVSGKSTPAAEAFRSLRTAVKFLGVDRDVRVIQVTSPSAGEGKTVTATNLATVLAQAGDRVVLVGADMRRPRAEEVLGVPLTPGLTGVLIGEVALPQAIRAVDGVPNLSVLPAGQPSPSPSELLSGDRAQQLFDVLAQTYDIVVVDCPPVLPVTDALVLARMSDATLLVTSVRKTSRRELERAVEVMDQVETRLSGAVITSMDPEDAYAEPYGYEATPRRDHRPKQHPLPPQAPQRAPDGNRLETRHQAMGTGVVSPPPAPGPERTPWPPEFPQRN